MSDSDPVVSSPRSDVETQQLIKSHDNNNDTPTQGERYGDGIFWGLPGSQYAWLTKKQFLYRNSGRLFERHGRPSIFIIIWIVGSFSGQVITHPSVNTWYWHILLTLYVMENPHIDDNGNEYQVVTMIACASLLENYSKSVSNQH